MKFSQFKKDKDVEQVPNAILVQNYVFNNDEPSPPTPPSTESDKLGEGKLGYLKLRMVS